MVFFRDLSVARRLRPPVTARSVVVVIVYHVALIAPDALSRYIQMLSLVPSDPDTLFHLGGLLDSEGDKQAAYQYFFDVSYTGVVFVIIPQWAPAVWICAAKYDVIRL